ncbi:MAG: hypothetical protein HKN82_14330 [Akkermansiaceae bacterium]|nr:hypothetical protein [Akkermansiaceae bacterium]NNM30023.1 hypothetical protein [Akkermansiaceae bacterium]
MKIWPFVLPVLLGAAVPLAGQEAEGEEPRKPRGRLAWFVATAIPDGLENPVSVMTGQNLTEVTLSRRSASEPVKIPADGIIRIVRKVENPEDPEKPAYRTLAQALVPEGMSKVLLILVPAPKSDSGPIYQTRVQDLAKFTGGDYLYINLTTVNVAVQLGETRIGLKPGNVRIYDAPALSGPTNVPVSYHYYHPEEKEWKMLSASTIVLRATRREICIFSWDPRFKRVNYHGITFPVEP